MKVHVFYGFKSHSDNETTNEKSGAHNTIAVGKKPSGAARANEYVLRSNEKKQLC